MCRRGLFLQINKNSLAQPIFIWAKRQKSKDRRSMNWEFWPYKTIVLDHIFFLFIPGSGFVTQNLSILPYGLSRGMSKGASFAPLFLVSLGLEFLFPISNRSFVTILCAQLIPTGGFLHTLRFTLSISGRFPHKRRELPLLSVQDMSQSHSLQK